MPSALSIDEFKGNTGGEKYQCIITDPVSYTHLENSNIELLKQTADAHKNTAVQSLVAKEMQNGSYYPKAMESSVRAIYGDKTAEILATPNNVLAVEYLKALPSNISPLSIRRERCV